MILLIGFIYVMQSNCLRGLSKPRVSEHPEAHRAGEEQDEIQRNNFFLENKKLHPRSFKFCIWQKSPCEPTHPEEAVPSPDLSTQSPHLPKSIYRFRLHSIDF